VVRILAPDSDNNNSRIYPPDPTYGRTLPFLQYDGKLLSRFETLFKAMGGSCCWETLRVTSFEFPKVLFKPGKIESPPPLWIPVASF